MLTKKGKTAYTNLFISLILFIFLVIFRINVYGNEYLLQQNDLLAISVWGHADLSADVRIGPDGNISLPLIGDLAVEGLSIRELNSLLGEKYGEYIKNPSINTVLREYHRPQIMILGEVRSPGRYQLESDRGILKLLSMAGGPTEKAALNQVTLIRGEEIMVLDLEGIFSGEKMDNRIFLLENEDVLYIPKGRIEVTIMGEVYRPGRYEMKDDACLLDLIAKAGGVTKKAAPELEYTSAEGIETVEIDSLLDGSLEGLTILKDGDLVYIPEEIAEISIFGEVRRPGIYSWKEEIRLSELLAMAGNQTEAGDISQIRINSKDNSSYFVDLSKYLEKGDLSANPFIQAGDSIYVNKRLFQVTILGEVNRPGTYKWHQEMTLDRLLASAGNHTDRGDLENIKIIHQDGSNQLVNLEGYFTDSETGENPLLKPGDMIKVEEVKGIDWEKVFGALLGVNLIRGLLGLD